MKAVFLDIDGVLQPPSNQERFDHLCEIDGIINRLNTEKPAEKDWAEYAKNCGKYDITATMFDWDPNAINRLHHILETTGAKIILSSDWRNKGMSMMRALLSIHNLDGYLYDSLYHIDDYNILLEGPDADERMRQANIAHNEYMDMVFKLLDAFRKVYPSYEEPKRLWPVSVDERTTEIREYLDRHQEITSYVAIDDRDLRLGLDGHAVTTLARLREAEAQKCIEILQKEDGPYRLPEGCNIPELQVWREKYKALIDINFNNEKHTVTNGERQE